MILETCDERLPSRNNSERFIQPLLRRVRSASSFISRKGGNIVAFAKKTTPQSVPIARVCSKHIPSGNAVTKQAGVKPSLEALPRKHSDPRRGTSIQECLFATTGQSSSNTLQTVRRRHQRLVKARDQYLLQQVQVRFQRENIHQAIEFVQGSQKELHKSLLSLMPLDSTHAPRYAGIAVLYQQLDKDLTAFDELFSALKASEATLTAFDSKLEQIDADFVVAAEAFTDDAAVKLQTSRASSLHYEALEEHPKPELHPLVAQYYTKAADVDDLIERLHDLDAQHDDQNAVRQLLEDQENALDLPEAVFQQKYIEQRRLILDQLQTTKEAVSDLQSRCRSQGLLAPATSSISSLRQAARAEGDGDSQLVAPPSEQAYHRATPFGSPGPIDSPLGQQSEGATSQRSSQSEDADGVSRVEHWFANHSATDNELLQNVEITEDAIGGSGAAQQVSFPFLSTCTMQYDAEALLGGMR